jgi:hypothetical protein
MGQGSERTTNERRGRKEDMIQTLRYLIHVKTYEWIGYNYGSYGQIIGSDKHIGSFETGNCIPPYEHSEWKGKYQKLVKENQKYGTNS